MFHDGRELQQRERSTKPESFGYTDGTAFVDEPTGILASPKNSSSAMQQAMECHSSFASSVKHQDTMDGLVGRELGSIRLLREMGRGGMGAVFEGLQMALHRKVAVKVLLPELLNDGEAIGRFQREAKALARLRNSHVVQAFDAGVTEDNLFYIVMEYLEGQNLAQELQQKGPYEVKEALLLILQAANGLEAAHNAGLVHRDIKPSNLMFKKNNVLCLTDFGLARTYQSKGLMMESVTQNKSVMGTPGYISPEQIQAQPLDGRSDIYSLGIVLYQLLVGMLPFQTDDCMQLLFEHLRKPCPDPRKLRPSIPEPVVLLLQSMVAKNRQERPTSAMLCEQLLQLLSEEFGFHLSSTSAQRNTPAYGVAWDHAMNSSSLLAAPDSSEQLPALGSSISSAETAILFSEVDGPEAVAFLLQQVQEKLATYIGSIARILIKQEIKKLGFKRQTLPLEQCSALISRLALRLSPCYREPFQHEAGALLDDALSTSFQASVSSCETIPPSRGNIRWQRGWGGKRTPLNEETANKATLFSEEA